MGVLLVLGNAHWTLLVDVWNVGQRYRLSKRTRYRQAHRQHLLFLWKEQKSSFFFIAIVLCVALFPRLPDGIFNPRSDFGACRNHVSETPWTRKNWKMSLTPFRPGVQSRWLLYRITAPVNELLPVSTVSHAQPSQKLDSLHACRP